MAWPPALAAALLLAGSARADEGCPRDAASWRLWQEREVERLSRKEYKAQELAHTADFLWGCPPANACLDNLSKFAAAESLPTRPGWTTGLRVSDLEFHQASPFPGMGQVPAQLRTQEFLELVARYPDQPLDAALAWIEKVNEGIADPNKKWLSFIYESQHIATPDDTGAMGRLFVSAPGEDYDQFIQFGLPSRRSKRPVHTVSIVAMQKAAVTPFGKKPLAPAVARLYDLWRVYEGGKIRWSTRLRETGRLENCYQCHKSPALPILPDPRTFDARRFGDILKRVNARIERYASAVYWGVDPVAYGPTLGPIYSPARTPEFIQRCSKGRVREPARVERFQRAMACLWCHNGERQGLLDFDSLSRTTLGHTMVDHYVSKHKRMPPPEKADLTGEERGALEDCLKQEYFGDAREPGLLRSWLLQRECWQDPARAAASRRPPWEN